MKTIIHINFSLGIGGTETMLVDIINQQCQTCFVTLIIVNRSYDNDLLAQIDEKVKVIKINRPAKSYNPFYVCWLNFIIWQINPNYIHCHNHKIIGLILVRTSKIYLTIHDVNLPIHHLKKYEKLFSISKIVQKDILDRSGIDSVLIYNGVQVKNITSGNTYLDESIFKIVQIGRLQHAKKGQHILLGALHQLINVYEIKNIHLHFIGSGESLSFLENLVDHFSLQNYVTFCGLKNRSFLYKNLKNYHLLVQPSLYEGFGLTIVEAMSAGIPVLASNVDGPSEIIQNEIYGYLFTSGDVNHCALSIREIMLKYNTESFNKKLQNSRAYAMLNFNIQRTVQEYLTYY